MTHRSSDRIAASAPLRGEPTPATRSWPAHQARHRCRRARVVAQHATPRSNPRRRPPCGSASIVDATNGPATRPSPRSGTGRSTCARTCVKCPSTLQCALCSSPREPFDDEQSAVIGGTGITVGHDNLRIGDGPSTSHTPPRGSPYIKPTHLPPTSCLRGASSADAGATRRPSPPRPHRPPHSRRGALGGDGNVHDYWVYLPIREAATMYQLADLRDTAEHDWGYVMRSTGFHEFVVNTAPTGRLTLILASDD